jgi:acetyltransferase-like isoleucine patch superfamily enzyme
LSFALAIYFYTRISFLIIVPAFPLVATLIFIFVSGSLRLLLPRIKAGVYDLAHPMTRAWYCHFLLGNALYVAGLQPLVYGSQIFKYLYWRSMGAKVEFGIICNFLTRIRDFELVEIGTGVSLSADTHIACHTYVGDRLLLGKVKIGRDAFLGMGVLVGPRSIIEAGAWIGAGNRLYREHIKAGQKVDNFAFEHGRPENYEKD